MFGLDLAAVFFWLPDPICPGKSTLLRAIGLNTVLAHLGAPVCATAMSLSHNAD